MVTTPGVLKVQARDGAAACGVGGVARGSQRWARMGDLRIRYGGVVAGQDEIDAATAVMRSQGWACGQVTRDLETALAAYMGLPHAVFLNSGTSGLLAAMRCLPEGSGVVMPALQFPTLYSAAIWCGLRPILCDISLDTLNMTGESLEKALAGSNADVLAVAFVHVAGNPAGIADVARICEDRGLILVEDCCEALGSESGGRLAGTFGDISVISTHAAHHMTTAVGGCAFTTREWAAVRMRRLRDWGRDIDGSGSYHFLEAGLNLQPSDIQAAIGLVQLGRLEEFGARRRANYAALAGQLAGAARLPGPGPDDDPSWFALPLLTSTGMRSPGNSPCTGSRPGTSCAGTSPASRSQKGSTTPPTTRTRMRRGGTGCGSPSTPGTARRT